VWGGGAALIRRLIALVAALLAGGLMPSAASAAPLPPIRHVFVIVLENESASTTFGPASPAPYLARTLTAQGAYLPNYYATGHESNDNYISMISGQAPNPQNQADCQYFTDLEPGTMGSDGQAVGTGCVYPAGVPTIASQLTAAHDTWRDYNEDMGNDPTREAAVCGHPPLNAKDNTQSATATDEYATRHDPFVYFHSIIDDTTLCDSHVVALSQLPADLSTASKTASYSFITPNLCNDGHDSPCANGQPGGLPQADRFLQTWVPRITGSPAFGRDGLLIITFDEASGSDASACCGEIPGPGSPSPGIFGPGGGRVGAVLLSPFIAPGTVSQTAYNHYTMLGSIENLFGLAHLGEAGLPGETYLGSDVFTRPGGAPGGAAPRPGGQTLTVRVPALASRAGARPRLRVRWGGGGSPAGYTVQVSDLSGSRRWRTLLSRTRRTAAWFAARPGDTYAFRVRRGAGGPWARAESVVPSGVRPRGGHFSGGWRILRRRGAWEQRAIQTTKPGASLRLRFRGGSLVLIGDRTAHGGLMRVTLDGASRLVRLDANRLHRRQIIYRAALRDGVHRLQVTDVRGLVALEGVAITDRRG
jgi:hypothetical protein